MNDRDLIKRLGKRIADREFLRYLIHPETSPLRLDRFVYYSTYLDIDYIRLRIKKHPIIVARELQLIQELDLLDTDTRECIYELIESITRILRKRRLRKRYPRNITLKEIVRFCLNKKLVIRFSDITFDEVYPGYYKARLKVCLDNDPIYKLLNIELILGYIEDIAYTSITKITNENDCIKVEIDIASALEEWKFKITVAAKLWDSGYSKSSWRVSKVYPIKLKVSQGTVGDFIELRKPYNYLREGIIIASNGRKRIFNDIRWYTNNQFPNELLCRKIYEDYTISQSVCKIVGSSLTMLVYEPIIAPDELGKNELDYEKFLLIYPKHPAIYPVIGYSRSHRALFFEIPAYGTIETYKTRIIDIPLRDLITIIESILNAVNSFRSKYNEHGLLTTWNIFLTSRGIKLGPPLHIGHKLFGIPMDSEPRDYSMLSSVIISMADHLLDQYNPIHARARTYIDRIAFELKEQHIERAYMILSEWKKSIRI